MFYFFTSEYCYYQIPHKVQEGYYSNFEVEIHVDESFFKNIIYKEKYCILNLTVKISSKNNCEENGLPCAFLLPY